MHGPISVLREMPDTAVFYRKFWNKEPFLVKKYVKREVFSGLVSADELAGLSLEDDVRSRLVRKGQGKADWDCEHGPFDEDVFTDLDERNWSLLVQDVDKHHEPTSDLLTLFSFSPRWLIDDIMVSYSVPGGGVGPHVDSYHVFLVQGEGKRRWKVGHQKIVNENYIDGIELKVLKDVFQGEHLEVEQGDVLYIPPRFAHCGETLAESLTYSIGFLGPSLSELLVEYGHFVEEQEKINRRYEAEMLDLKSAGDDMSLTEVDNFRLALTDVIESDQFEKWIRAYFTDPDS